MTTRFFFSISVNGNNPLTVTSKSLANVRFFWQHFIDKSEASNIIEKVGNRIVFDKDGKKTMIDYGSYTFENVDPYECAVVRL